MVTHDTQIRVRYGEVDLMGFLYHSHYVEYFDAARTQMLRDLGLPYAEIEAAGMMMPVLDLEIKYINPAHYDDLLTIKTIIKEMPTVKINFFYEVSRPSDETPGGLDLITTGRVTIAFMNSATKKACRVPESIKNILSKFFDED